MADQKSLDLPDGATPGSESAAPPEAGFPDDTKAIPLVLPLLAGLGLALSIALEVVHARTFLVPTADSFCAVGEAFDCTVVAASPFSVFLKLPWAIWGVLGYVALLGAILKRSVWSLYLSGVAALSSLGLLLLSLFKIGSLCYLCEAVHVTSWVLFALSIKHRPLWFRGATDRDSLISIFTFPATSALALWLFLPSYWGNFSYKADPPFATGITEEGLPWIGSESPTFTFHEFVDYSCPHCKLASTRTLKRLAEHPDWRVVRRQQPRMRCPQGRDLACRPSRIAFCAGKQGKFWRADRWLFTKHDPRKETSIREIAEDLELDENAMNACVLSEEAFSFAQSEYKAAVKAKILEVPGYLVDGKRYREDEFEDLVQNGKK